MTNVIQHPMVNEHGVQGNIKKSINSSTSGSKMDHFPLSPLRLEVPTKFLLLREKKTMPGAPNLPGGSLPTPWRYPSRPAEGLRCHILRSTSNDPGWYVEAIIVVIIVVIVIVIILIIIIIIISSSSITITIPSILTMITINIIYIMQW